MQLNKLNWINTHKVRNPAKIPDFNQNQFAFFGASNSGKSSLINYIAGQKKLTETSSKPGKTKSLDCFLVDSKFIIVDLPGHSYAIRSKHVKEIWKELIIQYLLNSKHLVAIFYLFDAKREIKKNDEEWLDLFDKNGIKYHLVMTKIDKIKKKALEEKINIIGKAQSKRPAMAQKIITSTVIANQGLAEISGIISKYQNG